MRIFFSILLLLITANVQAKFCQVIYISPTGKDITKVGEFYEFENNDVKIRYSFWAEGGLMGFMVYNKTNKPIYIDWKKSAMIYNGRNMPYYTNKTTSNYATYGSTYGSSWATIFNGTAYGVGASHTTTSAQETVVKQERTTFIPPHSYVSNAFYDLLKHITFTFDKRNTESKKINGTPVYVTYPTESILFRNYITYSTTEDFATEKEVDNEFTIAKIITLHENQFETESVTGKRTNEWKRPTRFYNWDIKRSDLFE